MRRHRLPEPFTFFIDECLGGRTVPDAVRGALLAGERVVVLPKGTLDLDWIPRAGEGSWVCLTKDHNLRHNPNERQALLSQPLAVLLLGEGSGREHADRIVCGLPCVRSVLRAHDVPLIGRIEKEGVVALIYERGFKLEVVKRIKPKRGARPG